MGWFGGLCSAIGGAIGGVCSAVCGGLGAIGAAIGGIAVGFAALTASPIFGAVLTAVSVVSSLLGITKKHEKPEELGQKMEKGKELGIKPDDFESTKEYIAAIRSRVELGPEDAEKLKNDKDYLSAMKCVGAGIITKALNEELNTDLDAKDFAGMAQLGMTGKEMLETLQDFEEKDVEPKIGAALDGELSSNENVEVISTLEKSIEKLDNASEISAKLDDMLSEL